MPANDSNAWQEDISMGDFNDEGTPVKGDVCDKPPLDGNTGTHCEGELRCVTCIAAR